MNIAGVLQTLNEMVEEGVLETYALGGAVAATYYLEPISTMDVDVFVRLYDQRNKSIIDPRPIFAFLSQKGHVMEGEYVMVEGWPVQFLAPPGELGEDALDLAEVADASGTPVRLLTAEHLAAIALETGRPKDKLRLQMFIESPQFNRSKFEELVERFDLQPQWQSFKHTFEV